MAAWRRQGRVRSRGSRPWCKPCARPAAEAPGWYAPARRPASPRAARRREDLQTAGFFAASGVPDRRARRARRRWQSTCYIAAKTGIHHAPLDLRGTPGPARPADTAAAPRAGRFACAAPPPAGVAGGRRASRRLIGRAGRLRRTARAARRHAAGRRAGGRRQRARPPAHRRAGLRQLPQHPRHQGRQRAGRAAPGAPGQARLPGRRAGQHSRRPGALAARPACLHAAHRHAQPAAERGRGARHRRLPAHPALKDAAIMRKRTRTIGLTLAGAAAAGATGALALVYSGWYDSAATRPHTAPVNHVLDIALRRSISVRAADIAVPALDDPRRALNGFKLFRAHCVQCHGAPGIAPDPYARGMMPAPAALVETARQWPASEVYLVIRQGIKMTGMPAWQYRLHDDDIWDVVAFMKVLPRLSPAQYREWDRKHPGAPAPLPLETLAQLRPGDPEAGR